MTEVVNEDCVCEGVDVKLVFENGTLGALTGEVKAYAGAVIPAGYLKCDGAAVSRVDYADLFEAIGTIYGDGDATTTFNVPDLRGEFIRGFDDGRGIDANRVLGSDQEDAFQGHTFGVKGYSDADVLGSANSLYAGAHSTMANATFVKNGLHGLVGKEEASILSNGVNGDPRTADETRPRNVAMMYIIKT